MNSLWRVAVFLTVFVAAAQCLTCQRCPVAILDACFLGEQVTCNNSAERCYRGEARFNATEGVVLYIRGCLHSALCERTITGSILGSEYTTSFSCCNTTLCNGASSVHIGVMAAVCSAVLSAVWTARGV